MAANLGHFRVVFLAPPDQLEKIYSDIGEFTGEFLRQS
jgi:hypothetical protein